MDLPCSVDSDNVITGTNNKPRPTPRRISGQNICSDPVSFVIKLYIQKQKPKKMLKPTATIYFCGTPFWIILPIKGIIIPVMIELGNSSKPASVAVHPNMDCV
ncbi:hypothetical protein D3C85_1549910 [compost metagenome]